MDSGKLFWNKIKIQPDIWFFYGFLLTFVLSVRKVLFYFSIKGAFNEYTGIYVYISDVFLFFSIILWILTLLYNKNNILSMYRLWITTLVHNLYILTSLLLVILSFLSIIWSQNQTIALFRSIKLLEYYLLYLYIIFRITPQSSFYVKLFYIVIALSLLQSFIGVLQFGLQHSLGLYWLKESFISPDTAGVAKIIINGQKYIRSYGLFPHPNILGGFLLFSIIISLLCKKLFHACPVDCSTWNIFYGVEHVSRLPRLMFHVEHLLRGGTILNIFILIQFIALLLTFSKSAIMGLAISLLCIYIVPRLPRGLFHVEHFLRGRTYKTSLYRSRDFKIVMLTILIILTFGYLFWPNLNLILNSSVVERIVYLNVSRGTILDNPLLGVGIGQFVVTISRYATELEPWQFQPVHNVFLLIWSELGIAGLALFIYWLYNLFIIKSILHNRIYFLSILTGLVFIMLFDHYFWDIQQGSFLLWITLGFVAGMRK